MSSINRRVFVLYAIIKCINRDMKYAASIYQYLTFQWTQSLYKIIKNHGIYSSAKSKIMLIFFFWIPSEANLTEEVKGHLQKSFAFEQRSWLDNKKFDLLVVWVWNFLFDLGGQRFFQEKILIQQFKGTWLKNYCYPYQYRGRGCCVWHGGGGTLYHP